MPPLLSLPFWSGINLLIGLVCVSIQIGIAVYCFRNRQQRGMRLYLLVVIIDALLMIVSTVKFVTVDEATVLLAARLQFVTALNAPFWLIFTLEFVGVGHWLTRPRRITLFIIFIVFALLTLTNDLHSLMFARLELYNNGYYTTVRVYPNVGYVLLAICMMAVIAGGLTLVSVPRWHSQSLYRSQRVAWFLATAFPIIGLLMVNMRLAPIPQLNMLPIAYLAGALITVYAVFRRRFFTVMPALYNTVFDSLSVALFTLDANERLISMNAAAKAQFGLSDSLLGKAWAQVVENLLPQHSGLRAGVEGEYSIGTQTFSVEHAALGQGKQARGRTLIVRDVSPFHRLRELEAFKTEMIRMAAHDLKTRWA